MHGDVSVSILEALGEDPHRVSPPKLEYESDPDLMDTDNWYPDDDSAASSHHSRRARSHRDFDGAAGWGLLQDPLEKHFRHVVDRPGPLHPRTLDEPWPYSFCVSRSRSFRRRSFPLTPFTR